MGMNKHRRLILPLLASRVCWLSRTQNQHNDNCQHRFQGKDGSRFGVQPSNLCSIPRVTREPVWADPLFSALRKRSDRHIVRLDHAIPSVAW